MVRHTPFVSDDPSRELERLAELGWRIDEHAIYDEGVWVTDAADAAVDFPEEQRAALAELESSSPWFDHRNRCIHSIAESEGRVSSLWEVGSGNGAASAYLWRAGLDVVAVEPSLQGCRNARRREVPAVIAGTLEALALPTGVVPALGLFDVLEHLARPGDLLDEARRVLEPTGTLLVTVPAHPSLWSAADVASGHHRRYTRRSLRRLLGSHGFSVTQTAHLFAAAAPAVLLLRAIPYRFGRHRSAASFESDLAPQGRLGTVERVALRLERPFAKRGLLPFGSSLLARAQRY